MEISTKPSAKRNFANLTVILPTQSEAGSPTPQFKSDLPAITTETSREAEEPLS
jgi:hypothetical protein